MILIESNNYGDISISNEELENYIKKYLNSFLSFELEIDSVSVVDSHNFYPVIKIIILGNSNENAVLSKLDVIAYTTEVFLNTNIGVKISGVQVGVKYSHNE